MKEKLKLISQKEQEKTIKVISKKVDELFCKLYKKNRKIIPIENMDKLIRESLKTKSIKRSYKKI